MDKEIFNAAFAFDYPGTDMPYIDDRIYTITAKFISQVRVNGKMNITETNITFKKCELSNYQNILINKNISQMLCPITMNFVLEGY